VVFNKNYFENFNDLLPNNNKKVLSLFFFLKLLSFMFLDTKYTINIYYFLLSQNFLSIYVSEFLIRMQLLRQESY
jgi:hypothetical protein